MVLLDDADAHNGALWLVPGSQLGGPRTDHDGPRIGDATPVRIDAPAGTVVLFPTLMVHRSDPTAPLGTVERCCCSTSPPGDRTLMRPGRSADES